MAYKSIDDLPDILNGISWNLKRIADQLEIHNDRNDTSKDQVKKVRPGIDDSKLRQFLAQLGDEKPLK